MTDEEIAKHVLAEMVIVKPYDPEDGSFWLCVGQRKPEHNGDGVEVNIYQSLIDADHDCGLVRQNSVQFILKAIRMARGQYHAPSPNPVTYLEMVRTIVEMGGEFEGGDHQRTVLKHLLEHIEHQDRLISFYQCEGQGESAEQFLKDLYVRAEEDARLRIQREQAEREMELHMARLRSQEILNPSDYRAEEI